MALTFSKATPDDWKTVASLETSIATSKVYKAITKEPDVRAYIQKSRVFLIYRKGQPIGTISYETKSRNHVYFDGLTIHPKHQRRGYASQAVAWLLDKLTVVEVIDLVTHPHNSAAIRLYLKFGFLIESWKENYFGDGEPRLHLVKRK